MIVYDKKGNKHIVCEASKNKKCEDCKAYVTRWFDNYTELGHDVDAWDECAFGYTTYENYLRYLKYIKEMEENNEM